MEQQNEPQKTNTAQQKKQDALDLAELIYDIFQDSLSNANIINEIRKDDKNV